MARLHELFFSFAKIGATTIGGGYAMLPLIEREVVEKKKWISGEDMLTCIAVGQITPGVIAVNTSTFVGYRQRGIPGAIAATLGMVVPSFIIISLIAALLSNFADLPPVQWAFRGIRVAVAALILDALLRLLKGVINLIPLLISLISLILPAFFSLSPVWVILGAGIAGLLLYPGNKKGGEKKT